MKRFINKWALAFVLLLSLFSLQAQEFSTKINSKTKFLEVKNSLCGIVVPWKNAVENNKNNFAPIQSFILANGEYCDTSINILNTVVKAYRFTPTIIKQTKGQFVILLNYKFKKQQFYFGTETYKGAEPGEGYYNVTITLWAKRKTITIEEELNYDVEYEVNLNTNINANTGRYRGFMANTKEDGYEPDGQPYRREYERGYTLDAQVDFNFEKEKLYYWFIPWSGPGVEINTGRYWQLFNSKAPSNGNMLGIYQGRPQRLIEAKAMGPRLKTYTSKQGNEQIDFVISNSRRGPDNSFATKKRIEWNVFIGTKSDIKPANQQQEIGNDFNYFSGLGQKIKLYATKPVKLVPAFYDGAIYMSKIQMQNLIRKVKTDESFYKYIVSFDDGLTNPAWESWRDSAKARKNIQELIQYKKDIINEYINGDGPYAITLRNSYGVRFFRSKAFIISALFADKSIKISKQEKAELEQLVGLIARVLWDNDNVPVNENLGIATGTANIMHQYTQAGRYFFALLLANDAEFSARAKEAYQQIAKEANEIIYPNGSTFGCPHYIGATFEPFLLLLLQLKQIGYNNIFMDKKIKDFANFYITLQTPPSIRFAKNRKLISYGDGAEENSILLGILGQGFYGLDNELSSSLYSLYKNGPVRGGFHAPAALVVDLTPQEQIALPVSSSSYEGYLSHCRIAPNTLKESAIWCINGNKYFDHRADDASELIIYALGVPLVVSRNAMYAPRADAAQVRSMVVPQKLFTNWDREEQPITNQPITWSKSDLKSYATFSNFTTFSIENSNNNLKWFRTVNTITTSDSTPIIMITDSMSNNDLAIFSLPMLAQNNIVTSKGNISAIPKKYFYNANEKDLPSGTESISFNNGWNKFSCIGQQWKSHSSNGINWDIYTFSNSPIKMSTANWTTNSASNMEQNEFLKTNNTTYLETLQFLRMQFSKKITSIIIPKNKNEEGYIVKTEPNNTVTLKKNKEIISINENYFTIINGSVSITGVLQNNSIRNTSNVIASGGTLQITENSTLLTIAVNGNTGKRFIELPFTIKESKLPNNKFIITKKSSSTTIETNVMMDAKNTPNGFVKNDELQLIK